MGKQAVVCCRWNAARLVCPLGKEISYQSRRRTMVDEVGWAEPTKCLGGAIAHQFAKAHWPFRFPVLVEGNGTLPK